MNFQVLRIQSYSFSAINSILGEADRQTEYSAHIASPKPPTWVLGSASAVKAAVNQHMETPVEWKHKNGRRFARKRRKDHRCLAAGFASWPTPLPKAFESINERQTIKDWCQQTLQWLKQYFGDNLIGMVLHADEGYFHMHFFVVGDANLLHPGLRQEFVDGQRLKSGRLRHERHVAGLGKFLDAYYDAVGKQFGLIRQSENPLGQRIENRDLAIRLARLESQMAKIADDEMQDELERLKAAATYRPKEKGD